MLREFWHCVAYRAGLIVGTMDDVEKYDLRTVHHNCDTAHEKVAKPSKRA